MGGMYGNKAKGGFGGKKGKVSVKTPSSQGMTTKK